MAVSMFKHSLEFTKLKENSTNGFVIITLFENTIRNAHNEIKSNYVEVIVNST